MSPHILYLEDDVALGTQVYEKMTGLSWSVLWLRKLSEAFESFKNNQFDLLVLDIGLSDGESYELLEKFKSDIASVPIIFTTARNTAQDRLLGYRYGAEQYIPKPFLFEELKLCVENVLKQKSIKESLVLEGLEIDFRTECLKWKDGRVEFLQNKDFKVLKCLIEASPVSLRRSDILERVWGGEIFPSERVIDNSIVRLRQALGAHGALIRSVRGVGYQWLITA